MTRHIMILVWAFLAATTAFNTIAQKQSGKKAPGQAVPQIILGDVINANESGMVIVVSNGDFCSGTLLTNEWALTAAHCHLDIDTPANISISMGSQLTTGTYAVNHPSLDFALVRLATPFHMNGSTTGYHALLYSGTTASLAGQTLDCRGYGCNAYTSEFDCTGNDGTLRRALLPVKSGTFYDDYNLTVIANARGQILAPGDSGTGCFVSTPQGLALAAVNKAGGLTENYLGRPENWRAWAMAYVNRTPIPLPDQWFVYTSTHPTFLKRPLPDSYNDAYTWNPCPGGRNFSFTPTFDLETGQDFITLQAGGTKVRLTGTGMTSCVGSGPLTATISTSPAHSSQGLLTMPISCDSTAVPSGQPTTSVPPAVCGVGNNIYFFARDGGGHVLYQRAILGQAGLCWSEIEGSGTTDAAPAAGAIGTHVFVAIKGNDGRTYLNQADLGSHFSAWFPLNFSTDVPLAVTGVGNNIYFFAKTLDGRIMYNRAVLGQAGIGWHEMEGNGRTDAPIAAGAVGTHVFVAIKGKDGAAYLNQADLGGPFGQWFPLGISTDRSLALTGVGNNIYFFAKSLDGRIMFNRAVLGQAGVGWSEVAGNARTNLAPAAGAVGTHVFIAITGRDGRIYVNQADLAGPFGQWF